MSIAWKQQRNIQANIQQSYILGGNASSPLQEVALYIENKGAYFPQYLVANSILERGTGDIANFYNIYINNSNSTPSSKSYIYNNLLIEGDTATNPTHAIFINQYTNVEIINNLFYHESEWGAYIYENHIDADPFTVEKNFFYDQGLTWGYFYYKDEASTLVDSSNYTTHNVTTKSITNTLPNLGNYNGTLSLKNIPGRFILSGSYIIGTNPDALQVSSADIPKIQDKGKDLSSFFTESFNGTLRTGNFSIGPWEY